METITLSVERREPGSGGAAARGLRRTGRIPGVVYGRQETTAVVQVSAKEFVRKLGRIEGTHLIRLESTIPELNGKIVILKEVQVHPVTSDVLHADFYAIDLTRRLRVQVPLHFQGKPVGVTAGGVLQPVRREITVACLPDAIPGAIEIDVSGLGIYESIHAEDIKLPEGVEAVFDSNFAVVTVLPPTVEAAAPEAAAAPAEGEAAAVTAAQPAADGESATAEKGKEKKDRKEKKD
jgi:large subunit ribosomal protein L25